MKELVGTCSICQQDVFCEDGFFNGIHEDGKIICFTCYEKNKLYGGNRDEKEKRYCGYLFHRRF
ncbi:hypothetical protein FN924_07385 [Radiobacillus deserti]|uniref:Uncharacterized protein n=1 Tax=Radiobacillus deserti TaxID=2594883 RepID=A0A516KF34_9BACI|nr:hypothetical protein FN924_07385 [Radiobacillus deserti]